MRQYIPVITLAAALLPCSWESCSLRITWSTRPILCSTTIPGSRSVPENTPPGVNIGDPISATDADEDGEGRYRVRRHADLQPQRHGRGVVRHRRLDRTAHHEGPWTRESEGGTSDNNSYTVTVTVKDSSGTSVTQDVTITPSRTSKRLRARSPRRRWCRRIRTTIPTTYELKVIWYAPDDDGDGMLQLRRGV